MSFVQLFLQADRAAGLLDLQKQSEIGRQEDTSSFDAFLGEEPYNDRKEPQLAEPETSNLRNVVRYVPREMRSTQERVVVQHFDLHSNVLDKNHRNGKIVHDIAFNVPEVDWQSEVKRIMLEDHSFVDEGMILQQHSRSQPRVVNNDRNSIIDPTRPKPTVLRRPLPLHAVGLDNIDTLSCIDVGAVSMATAEHPNGDALENFIPNRTELLELSGRVVAAIDESDSSERSDEEDDNHSIRSDVDAAADGAARGGEHVGSSETLKQSTKNARPLTKSEQKELEKAERAKAARVEQALLEGMSKEERLAYHAQKKAERLMRVNMTLDYSRNRRIREEEPAGKSGVHTNTAAVSHSKIALNHLNTRLDLSSVQLRYFHRPRLIRRNRRKKWRIALSSSVAGSGVRRAGQNGNTDVNQEQVSSSGSNSLQSDNVNLCVANGSYFLIEYVEEHPPLRVNYGMGSRIVNYYRAPDTRNQQDKAEEEDAAKERKAAAQAKRQNLLNQCRLPRHLRLLLSQRDEKREYDYDANVPRLPVGETRVLGPTDESPFLGDLDIEEIQQSIVNGLYRAPLFERKVARTDFLLVCTGDGRKGGDMSFVLRDIPRIFVCGQMEPLRKVTRPYRHSQQITQNRVSIIQERFMRLCVARFFAHASQMDEGIEYSVIERALFSDYTLDTAWSRQRDGFREALKHTLSELADKQSNRSTGETRYKPKNYALIDSALDLETMHSPEELLKAFTPEDVCVEEACAAGEFRLRELGILEVLPLNELWSWLQLMGRLRVQREYRAAYVKYEATELRNTAKVLHTRPISKEQQWTSQELETERQNMYERADSLDRLCAVYIGDIKKLDEKIEIGRFIFDRLMSAPWNTTAAYVHSVINRDGMGRMEVDGPGDPSGCHEAFAFVRIEHPTSNGGINAKKSSEKIFGTEKDLRKLTKEDSIKLCVAYGMAPADARNLKRWDRIHAIRHYSTKAVLTGVMHEDKFARSGAVRDGTSKESSFKKKCQLIWARQKAALRDLETMIGKMQMGSEGDKAETPGLVAGAEQHVEDKEGISQSGSEKEPMDTSAGVAVPKTAPESDSDDSDFDIEADDFVENCVADKAREIAEEQHKKKLAESKLQRSREDRQQMQDLLKGLSSTTSVTVGGSAEVADITVAPRIGPITITGGVQSAAPIMLGGSGASRPVRPSQRKVDGQPLKVVRKITRTMFADGTEEIVVQFFLSEKDVKRVSANKERQSRLGDVKDRSRGGRVRANSLDDDEDFLRGPTVASTSNPLALKVGKMRKAALENKAEAVSDDVYKSKHTSSRGAGFPVYRLPHVAFAALLEQELMGMCTSKASPEFWMLFNPVPRTVPRYYEVIERPICLLDIRENIANYKYLNYRLFLDDLDLMIYNARLFNGENSKIAQKAVDIKNRLCDNLELKRRTLGMEKCPIRNFEEVIKKKYLYLGRAIPQSVPLPKHNPVAQTYLTSQQQQSALGPPQMKSFASESGLSSTTIHPSSSALFDAIPLQKAVSFAPGFAGESSPGDSNIDYSPSMASSSGQSPTPIPGSSGYGGSSGDYSPGQGFQEYSPAGSPSDTSPTSDFEASPYSSETHEKASNSGYEAPSLRTVPSFMPSVAGDLSVTSLRALGTGVRPLGSGISSASKPSSMQIVEESSDDEDWMVNDEDDEEEADEEDGDDEIGMDMDA